MKLFLCIPITMLLCSLLGIYKPVIAQQEQAYERTNPYHLSPEKVQWMHEATLKQLEGCRIEGYDGTWMHTPDGIGNYKALWTRDYYYMVEYAGDLLDPAEIRASIRYLLQGQREDGCMPDRVNAAGKGVYSPGGENHPLADHALDNGPFMAMLVCSYVNQYSDADLFQEAEPQLRRGLDFVSLAKNGLVYNDPEHPQCVYGFTDIVKKTGHLLFSSLLFYKANWDMYKLCQQYGMDSAEVFKQRYEAVKENIHLLWDENTGMYLAADQDCRQTDIWGSAYAIEVGITTEAQTQKITEYLVSQRKEILMRGQIRHLAGTDSAWHQLLVPCKAGTYQNGAYWATPLAWIIPVFARHDQALAKEILESAINDFQKNGISECINEGYLNVPNYVASATSVYSLLR